MKRQIKSIKVANPQEMARCTTYTTSSIYMLDKPSQRRSTGNSSAAQNTDVERVDQSAGGKGKENEQVTGIGSGALFTSGGKLIWEPQRRKRKVRDTRPEGGKTLNRRSKDILHRMLNGFPSRNGGSEKLGTRDLREGRLSIGDRKTLYIRR